MTIRTHSSLEKRSFSFPSRLDLIDEKDTEFAEHRKTYRLCVCGSESTGKTSLAMQLQNLDASMDCSLDNNYDNVISVDGRRVKVVAHDCNTDEWTDRIMPKSVANCDCLISVYAINSHRTFMKALEVISWLRGTEKRCTAVMLVGNKSDLVRCREVRTEEGLSSASHLECGFIETSATLPINVEDMYRLAVKQITSHELTSKEDEEMRRRAQCAPRRRSYLERARAALGRIFKPTNQLQRDEAMPVAKSRRSHSINIVH